MFRRAKPFIVLVCINVDHSALEVAELDVLIEDRESRHYPRRLPDKPEFVFEEEVSVRRRDWAQHVQFYCGGGYLAGKAAG